MTAATVASPTIWARAKDEVRRRGWHQGAYGANPTKPRSCAVCLIGAINAALCGDPWFDRSTEAVQALLAIEEHLGTENISAWNDDPARTINDVYRLFDDLDAKERHR